MPATSRTPILWLILLALIAAFVWLEPWRSPPRPWDYLELAPVLESNGGGAAALAIDRGDLDERAELVDGPPIDLELRLVPQAALVSSSLRLGRESLTIHSVALGTEGSGSRTARDVSCAVRVVAGLPQAIERTIAGKARIEGLPRGRILFAFEGPNGRRFDSLVRVPRADPLVVDWATSGGLRGRVQDERGAPIGRGAIVEVQGKRIACDDEGRFEVRGLVCGDSVPVLVRAAGKALYAEIVDVRRESVDLRFSLAAAWSIRLTAPDTAPETIALVPLGGVPKLFPYYALEARPLGRGRFQVDGLPLRHDIGVAFVSSTHVSSEPTAVAAPLSARTLDVSIGADRPVRVRGRVQFEDLRKREAGVDTEIRATVTAVDARKQPWGRTLFVREALLPPAWALLGASRARTDADGRYELAMPSRRTRLVVEAPQYEGQARVLHRARRLRANFTLAKSSERASGEVADGAASARATLALTFVDLPRSVTRLRIRVFWNGEPRGRAIVHDPRRVLEVPLGGAALLEVSLRRSSLRGSGGSTAAESPRTVRAVGRTAVEIAYPDV